MLKMEKMLMARGRGGACKIQRFGRRVDCIKGGWVTGERRE